MRVLAIDQGTTSTRGLVFSDSAPPRVAASIRHRQYYPQPGWVEHDPRDILANVKACLAAAGKVDAIGIANQGESCLAWDAVTLNPLSPIIVWQDRRTEDIIQRLKAEGAEPQVTALSGLPLDSYFSATKLAWLLDHNPQAQSAWRAGRLRLGTTDTFLLENLAGVHATDPTTASRTGLMNIATCSWDDALCAMFGVPIECLAPIRPSTGPFGDIDGTPILASLVDQQAALFGHGCRHAGDAKITFGTGGFALALAGDRPVADAGKLTSTVAWQTATETRYAVEGGVYDAGAAVEWAMRIGLLDDPLELRAFDEPPAISRGLAFVPALSGLACPQWDRGATGLWIGMTTATTRRDLQQSILEGVALQTCEVIAELQAHVGLGDALCVDGGLSASDYFLRFLASVAGKTIVRSASTELTAYGCALLAGLPRPASGVEGERFEPPRYDKSLEWIEHYRQACGLSASWNHGFQKVRAALIKSR
jgi:glycerol kinase